MNVIDTSRAQIQQLAEALIVQFRIKEWGLEGWEFLHGQLRGAELRFVGELCAIQRSINSWMQGVSWALEQQQFYRTWAEQSQENAEEMDSLAQFVQFAQVKAVNEFQDLQFKAQTLLTWTYLRDQCEKWILVGYLLKQIRGIALNEAENVRRRSFSRTVEYGVGRVEDGMVDWFQLHNLALDQASSIQAAMGQAVSLFPGEE